MNQKNPQETTLIIQKEYEKQTDFHHFNQWRSARSRFFTHQIRQQLNDANIQEKQQDLIIDLFMQRDNNYFLKVQISENHQLAKHSNLIQTLATRLYQIQISFNFKQRFRFCIPIQKIIYQKLTTLQIIRIQYQQYPQYRFDYIVQNICSYRYLMMPIDLFAIIFLNKHLKQVSIKGVLLYEFDEFIGQLNRIKNNEIIEKYQLYDWLKQFNANQVKLSINGILHFMLRSKDDLSLIEDFLMFRSLFYQVSDITAKIYLLRLTALGQWQEVLSRVWKCLKQINKIKMVFEGDPSCINVSSISSVRSVLFGGLTQFTEIAQLSFYEVGFRYGISITDYLAIQRILSTIFENNTITYLQLRNCSNFPVIPKTTTLQSVSVCSSFRSNFGLMNQTVQNNPQIRFIRCSSSILEWRSIDKQLFNKLQVLDIYDFIYDDKSSHSPLSIKKLSVWGSNVGLINDLSMLFPRLINLASLSLKSTDFEHELLCMIPSPHLKELGIIRNNAITNRGIQVIDSKWPNLSNLTLGFCSNITENVWQICKFTGLIQIRIELAILGEGNKVLRNLKNRGIKVDQLRDYV